MKLHGGGFLIAVSDLDISRRFYCGAMQLRTIASDGTSAMLGPEDEQSARPWLLALRETGRQPLHAGGGATGVRAVFFRIETDDIDDLEQRLRDLGGFSERHVGEFYEMVSAHDPDRTSVAFWATKTGAVEGPSFVPPSIYFLDE